MAVVRKIGVESAVGSSVGKETAVNKNIGSIDRIFRLVVGGVLIAYALNLIAPDTGYNVWGWIGLLPILTALVSFCPAYRLLGINTKGS